MRGKLHGQRSLVGYHPWGHKELDMTEHTHTHTHIIIVARGVPHTSVGKESTCNAEDLFDSCVRKIPWNIWLMLTMYKPKKIIIWESFSDRKDG